MKYKTTFLFLICVLLGGTGWIFVPVFNQNVAPEISLFHRFLVSGIILIGIHFFKNKESLGLRERINFKNCFISGVLLYSLNYYLAYLSADYLPSGVVSASLSLICFPNMIFGYLILKKKPDQKTMLAAVLLSLAVYLLLLGKPGTEVDKAQIIAFIFCFLSTFLTSLANVLSSKEIKPRNEFLFIGISMLFGALTSGGLCALTGKNLFPSVNIYYIISMIYVSLLATAAIYVLYFRLMSEVGPVRASFVWLVSPVIALALSSLFEGYSFGILTFAGVSLLVLGGIVDVKKFNRKGSERKRLLRPFFKKSWIFRKRV